MLITLSGCATSIKQEIETHCLSPFTQETQEFFEILDKDKAYIWAIHKERGESAPFLVKNGIKGYLLPNNSSNSDQSIKATSMLTVTGRVYKYTPSWAGANIGGSRKNIQLEVVVEGNNYLVFDLYIPSYLQKKLAKKCTFKK